MKSLKSVGAFLARNKFLTAVVVIGVFMAAQATLSYRSDRVAIVSKTYAGLQVDTVKFSPPAGLSGLAFGIHLKDSSNLSKVIVRRVFDGVASAVIAGDTLTTTDTSATAVSYLKTVTLAPIPDQYWFIVTYDSVALQGVTTPTVVYGVVKQLSK